MTYTQVLQFPSVCSTSGLDAYKTSGRCLRSRLLVTHTLTSHLECCCWVWKEVAAGYNSEPNFLSFLLINVVWVTCQQSGFSNPYCFRYPSPSRHISLPSNFEFSGQQHYKSASLQEEVRSGIPLPWASFLAYTSSAMPVRFHYVEISFFCKLFKLIPHRVKSKAISGIRILPVSSCIWLLATSYFFTDIALCPDCKADSTCETWTYLSKAYNAKGFIVYASQKKKNSQWKEEVKMKDIDKIEKRNKN